MSTPAVAAGQGQRVVPGSHTELLGRPSSAGVERTREAVTVIMGVVVGLTFMFGFGNVLSLGLRLGVSGGSPHSSRPPLTCQSLPLLLATRHLALSGASVEELRPARQLLLFASLVTLALNVADPLLAGEWGKAAFDAVGPLLLIGWAHVGPELLHALSARSRMPVPAYGDCAGDRQDERRDRRPGTALHGRQIVRIPQRPGRCLPT